MNTINRKQAIAAIAGLVLALGIGTAAVLAAGDGIGDTTIPVEPDGGIGDTPIPVEPDGGIGDTPGDQFPIDVARDNAHGLLGLNERDLPADVRIARIGNEQFALTEDYVLGRLTVDLDDLDDGGYRVTSVTVELPDGTETFHLTPG